jgi:hypothetical protein
MWQRTGRLYLPRTGQTTSYRDHDDGYYETGFPHATRFVANGNNTVFDRATGLTWVADPSQLGGVWGTPGSPSQMTWNDAIDNCAALSHGGMTDWRLPNKVELESIVDLSQSSPAIDTSTFPNTQSQYYWASTARAANTTWAWEVQFSTGYDYYTAKTDSRYVRPVRGGRING